jgi:LysM domain
MDDQNFARPWAKRARFLTQLLVLSGTLNVALLATFSFFLMKGRKKEIAEVLPPLQEISSDHHVETLTNAEILRTYCEKSFTELLQLLEDRQLIEEGYAKRDLALAVLVAFHHFNLERALGGMVVSQRQILFSPYRHAEQIDFSLFPDLTDEQFQAMTAYAKTERWPLTNQGLYFEIKRAAQAQPNFENIDKTLLDTFCLSSEFLAVTTLFSRTGWNLSREDALRLVCEGNWSILERFATVQKYTQDFSLDRQRILLVEYLDVHSKTAARLFLAHDAEFAARRLKDEYVFTILEEGKEDPKALALARALLCSMRSNRIYRYAASKLYQSVKEQMPEPYEHIATLRRFCPEVLKAPPILVPPQQVLPAAQTTQVHHAPAQKSKKIHVVQEGDSLWKIARKHHVKIEAIMQVNHLESEKLRVGKQLEIPEHTETH